MVVSGNSYNMRMEAVALSVQSCCIHGMIKGTKKPNEAPNRSTWFVNSVDAMQKINVLSFNRCKTMNDSHDTWTCLFCTTVNGSNVTVCSQCDKANSHVVNTNQICLCGRKVVKYRYAWNECHSCCKRREKKEKGYYDCKAKQCI
eukprot:442425_1